MKYLCLAYYDVEKMDALPKAELDAIVNRCAVYDADLRASGQLLLHGSLGLPQAAPGVRPREGGPTITDGPYTETKEQVGGFFIVEAHDLNDAIRVASKHPAAHLGQAAGWGIEVRSIDWFEQVAPIRD
jgi:hypothetical protein